MIACSILLLFLFFATGETFYSTTRPEQQPVSQNAISMHSNLLYQCQNSMDTHGLYLHYQSLLTLRQTGTCASMDSIESCAGYQAKAPYTAYLKTMENDFRCSGWCGGQTHSA